MKRLSSTGSLASSSAQVSGVALGSRRLKALPYRCLGGCDALLERWVELPERGAIDAADLGHLFER